MTDYYRGLSAVCAGLLVSQACLGEVIWKADFQSYNLLDPVSQANRIYDAVNFYKPADMSFTVKAPDFFNQMQSDQVAQAASFPGAFSVPLIKLGLFDNPAFGSGNGTDVMILGFDVYGHSMDPNSDNVANNIYLLTSTGGTGPNFGSRSFPAEHLLRMTVIANASASAVALPDLNGDGVNESLLAGKARLISRNPGGVYTDYGELTITSNVGGLWMRHVMSEGMKDYFFDNFIASNNPADQVNGIGVMELPPNLAMRDGGVQVTNNNGLPVFSVGIGAKLHAIAAGTQSDPGKVILDKVPAELDGLQAVQAADERSSYAFTLDAPARGYFLVSSSEGFKLPPGWKLYRQEAANIGYYRGNNPVPYTTLNYKANIYYKDFAAGPHTVTFYNQTGTDQARIISANLGFQNLNQLGLRNISLNQAAPHDYNPDIPETWVHRSNEPRDITLQINNPSGGDVPAEITLQLAGGPEQTVMNTVLTAGDNNDLSFALDPFMPDEDFKWGTFRVKISVPNESQPVTISSTDWPIAKFDIPPLPTQSTYMLGAYDKSNNRSWDPVMYRIYTHGIFYRLRQSGFNGVLTVAYFNTNWYVQYMELAQQYGLQVVARIGNVQNPSWAQPGANRPYDQIYTSPIPRFFIVGDEPNQNEIVKLLNDYTAVRNAYGASFPMTTTLIGEVLDDPADPYDGRLPTTDPENGTEFYDIGDQFVDMAQPIHRMMRHYRVRRTFDLVNWSTDNMEMSPADQFALYERSYPSDWWLISQGLGKGLAQVTESVYRLPTQQESNAYLHLALANGSRGIIAWPLQVQKDDLNSAYALHDVDLNSKTISRNQTYPADAYLALSSLIEAHGELLYSHKPATSFTATAVDPNGEYQWTTPGNSTSVFRHTRLVVNARTNASGTEEYVYMVNLDAEAGLQNVQIQVDVPICEAIDIYTGTSMPITDNGDGTYTISTDMNPGQGQFIQLVR